MNAPVDFSKWARETLNQYAAEAMRRLIEQDEELSRLRRESEAVRDMLESARADLEAMREALGVPGEPHQSLTDRMVEAAQRDRVPSFEMVRAYLVALAAEARRRGSMFPQTSDEQDADASAIRRVTGMVEWYGDRSQPMRDAVLKTLARWVAAAPSGEAS